MTQVPVGWADASLGQIADFIMGQAPPGADCNKARRGTPFVKAGEFGPEHPVIREWTTRPLKLAQEGDVLICVVGATSGKINLGADCAIGRSVAAIRPSDALSQQYLYEFLSTKVLELRSGSVGTAQGVISRDDLANIEIPLAPLPEQRRIVAKIDSLSAKSKRARDQLDHVPRLVEKYKQAIFAAAFRGDLTREWRNAHMLKEPRPARVQELLAAPIRNGLSVRGSDIPPGVRALRLSALRGSMVDLSDVRYLPISEDKAERFLLRQGDVLVSRGNGTKAFVGRAALVGQLPEPTIFPDTAFRLRFDEMLARPAWIAKIWNAEPMRRQIEQAARTTAGIWKIAQSDLDQLDIVLPCPAEQDEISNRLNMALAWIDRLAAEAVSARKLIDHLHQAVLAKAFRGELVPQDPNDEPESVLLERIRAERQSASEPLPRKDGQKAYRRTE